MNVPYAVAAPAALGQARRLVGAVEQLDDRSMLEPSRCFGWTRADLLAHVHLGLQDMLLGLVDPTDNLRFARLLASAYRRPTGLIGHLRPTTDGVLRAIEAFRAAAVHFQGHVLTGGDFLATWATELAVHHLDLDLGSELPGPDPAALRLARQTADALAGQPSSAGWDDEYAVLVGWGRIPHA